jgi:hypothetical protein
VVRDDGPARVVRGEPARSGELVGPPDLADKRDDGLDRGPDGGADGGLEVPPELVAGVAGSLRTALAQARSPLAAELVLCRMLGMLETGIDGGEPDRADAVRVLLTEVIDECDRVASVEALAVLRVCSTLGPAETRAAAKAAADRLEHAGVADRPWVGRLARPAALRAWRYGDVFGQQSSIGVLFDDRGREHVLMVLVDHALGGGIKDAWVAEGKQAKGLRNRIAANMADEPVAVFEDIDVRTAAQGLREALACPPCPEQDDQIEDVATHLFLVRSRADHLAALADPPLAE